MERENPLMHVISVALAVSTAIWTIFAPSSSTQRIVTGRVSVSCIRSSGERFFTYSSSAWPDLLARSAEQRKTGRAQNPTMPPQMG